MQDFSRLPSKTVTEVLMLEVFMEILIQGMGIGHMEVFGVDSESFLVLKYLKIAFQGVNNKECESLQ